MSTESLQLLATAATAVGVFLVCLQLRLAKRQAVTAFEDNLAREFRETIDELPVKVLLGDQLDEHEQQEHLDEFYHYIDLTNEQVFLRLIGRISLHTWIYWCDGIQALLSLPAFAHAWTNIKKRAPASFHELRRLEAEGFKTDPHRWKRTKNDRGP
jgi:hypothetical protein